MAAARSLNALADSSDALLDIMSLSETQFRPYVMPQDVRRQTTDAFII